MLIQEEKEDDEDQAELDGTVSKMIQNSIVKEAVANRKRQILESADFDGINQNDIPCNVKDQIDQVYHEEVDLNDTENGRASLRIAENFVRTK